MRTDAPGAEHERNRAARQPAHHPVEQPDRPADAAHRPDANRAAMLRPEPPGARVGCGSRAHPQYYITLPLLWIPSFIPGDRQKDLSGY